MADRHLTKLAFLLALTGISHASMIPYSIQQTVTVAPSGQHLEFASAFTVQQFDPALGVLDSIDFRYSIGGLLSWKIASIATQTGGTDVYEPADFTFLGVSAHHDEGVTYVGTGGMCGIPTIHGYPPFPTCRPGTAWLSGSGGLYMDGTIRDGSSSLGYNLNTGFTGLPPTSLAGFHGDSTVDLPITFSLDSRGSGWNGIVLGDFDGPQTLRLNLNWNYNYTQTPVVAPLTATPEPRLVWLLVGIAIAAIRCKGKQGKL